MSSTATQERSAPHGGYRPGSGRPKGAKTRAKPTTVVVKSELHKNPSISLKRKALAYLEEGVAPVEVLLTSMRRFYDRAEQAMAKAQLASDPDLKAEFERETDYALRLSCDIAKDVAPYVHPKLNAVALAENKDAVEEAFAMFEPSLLKAKLLGGIVEGVSEEVE